VRAPRMRMTSMAKGRFGWLTASLLI